MNNPASPPAPRRLDTVLAPLAYRSDTDVLSPLFQGGAPRTPLVPGAFLHHDPAGQITGHWHSPQGRLIEIAAEITVPCQWFALHLALDLPDLSGIVWLGFVARSSASPTAAIRACLRSGTPDGFHDCFFDRHILAQSRESDHQDLIAPARREGLPMQAPWREFILFLPPARSLHWVLHDLRIFTL